MSSSQIDRPAVGEMGATISTGVVHLLAEYTGRGPTRARTYIHDDLITIVLQDVLTKGERSLVHDGEASLVLEARKAYQRTMTEDLVGLVEQASGRKVRAFLSDNHIEPDIAVESFVLVPVEDGGEGRDGRAIAP